LISPFVGRILDWNKKAHPQENYAGPTDPGVISVTKIYNYLKKHEFKTIIMGASFRNIQQILELSGCDKLTISPKLLDELQHSHESAATRLDAKKVEDLDIPEIDVSEKNFRWIINEDQMATEKLREGITTFAKDLQKVEELVQKKLKEYVAPVVHKTEESAAKEENKAKNGSHEAMVTEDTKA